jgi:hypothetical protein
MLNNLKVNEHKELYRTNKFIKNEVIDIAEMVEKVSKSMLVLNEKVEMKSVQNNQVIRMLSNLTTRIDRMEGKEPMAIDVGSQFAVTNQQESGTGTRVDNTLQQSNNQYADRATNNLYSSQLTSSYHPVNESLNLATQEGFNIRKSPFYEKKVTSVRKSYKQT